MDMMSAAGSICDTCWQMGEILREKDMKNTFENFG